MRQQTHWRIIFDRSLHAQPCFFETRKRFNRCDHYFQERLDLEEMIDYVSGLAKAKFSTEQLQEIDDEDLTERIDKVLTIEVVSGTLNDLTPEQIKIFDAAVEGREVTVEDWLATTT